MKPQQRVVLQGLGFIAAESEEQPRDEAGRFAKPSPGGFDGGARQPVPVPTDPLADHNALLVELRARRLSGHGGGFTL